MTFSQIRQYVKLRHHDEWNVFSDGSSWLFEHETVDLSFIIRKEELSEATIDEAIARLTCTL